MDLRKIISIPGKPGLFKVVAQTNNSGFVVESLIDKKRMPAYSHYRISSLSDISVYTSGENVSLADVFKKIMEKENSGPASVDMKGSDEDLRKYFGSVLPEYDKEKVHASDIRKALNWYNILQKNDLLKEEEKTEGDDTAGLITEEKTKSFSKVNPKDSKVKTSSGHIKTSGVRKVGGGS